MDLDISSYTAEEMIEILDLKVVDKNSILKSTEDEMKKYEKKPNYSQIEGKCYFFKFC